MKKQNILFVAGIAFAVGVAVSWLLFGTKDPAIVQSENPEATPSGQTWTCSMHPQVRQNEPGLCPICEMDLIPLETNSSNDPLILEMTENAVALANIQTTTIGSGETPEGSQSLRLSGRIKPDERRVSSQVSHVPGRIEKLYVSFTGEKVRKGQKIAEVYSPELITAQKELIEASRLSGNNALLEAAKNKLKYWKIPEETIDEILNSETSRELFPVYASESGIVNKRNVAVGDYISKGTVLLELINLDRLWVLFDAYEKDFAYIQQGQQIEFTTNAYPDKKFSARVSFIDPQIDPKTRVAKVRTEISNSAGILKPEMFVTGILTSAQSKNKGTKVLVPKSAVMWTGKRSVVYTKIPDREIPSFRFREIELGPAVGDYYEVGSGLSVGEEVVTHGSFVIDAAAQLNNQASMINRDVKIKSEQEGTVPDFSASTPEEFKAQVHDLANRYLVIKDAMVESNPGKVSAALEPFERALNNVDMKLLSDEAHMFWMEQLEIFKAHSQIISNAKDIEEQRAQFEILSNALISTVEAFGLDTGKLYVQYCPMAFNNKGASWLSEQEEIRNPYFGDKMLKCGVVKDTFE